MDATHFGFVNISPENQIVHVCYRSNGSTVVECITHDCRLPAFTGTSRINPSIVERIMVLLNEALFLVIPSFFYNFQIIFGSLILFRACFTATSPFS